jgi:hypothetical protein
MTQPGIGHAFEAEDLDELHLVHTYGCKGVIPISGLSAQTC